MGLFSTINRIRTPPPQKKSKKFLVIILNLRPLINGSRALAQPGLSGGSVPYFSGVLVATEAGNAQRCGAGGHLAGSGSGVLAV